MENVIVNENDIGYVKIYKDEISDFNNYEEYKNLPNAIIEREATNDEFVTFKTFNHSKAKTTVWLLEQYDMWFSSSSRVIFGVYSSREAALKTIGHDTDTWKQNYYDNGTNQWKSDILECGIMVREINLDEFEEI